MMNKSVFLPNEAATKAQAKQLAKRIRAGDCLALTGNLGVGKSLFARALMRALGVRDHALPSPSFSLIEEYEGDDGLRIAHMDWYRLSDPDEVILLGVSDYFQPPWFSIIEWPERASTALPATALHIELTLDASHESGRWFTVKN